SEANYVELKHLLSVLVTQQRKDKTCLLGLMRVSHHPLIHFQSLFVLWSSILSQIPCRKVQHFKAVAVLCDCYRLTLLKRCLEFPTRPRSHKRATTFRVILQRIIAEQDKLLARNELLFCSRS